MINLFGNTVRTVCLKSRGASNGNGKGPRLLELTVHLWKWLNLALFMKDRFGNSEPISPCDTQDPNSADFSVSGLVQRQQAKILIQPTTIDAQERHHMIFRCLTFFCLDQIHSTTLIREHDLNILWNKRRLLLYRSMTQLYVALWHDMLLACSVPDPDMKTIFVPYCYFLLDPSSPQQFFSRPLVSL